MRYVKPSFKTYPQLHWLYMYIAGKCNLRCRHCWIDPEPAEGEAREGEGYLPYDLFLKALDEAAPLGLRGVKYTGGEPLLHPRLADMLREGKRRGLSQMVETNGTLVTPELAKVMAECANRVSVSIDGATAETHDSFRGTNGAFDKSTEGIRSLSRAGVPSSRIEVICMMREEAVRERGEFMRLVGEAGAGGVKYNLLHRIGRARAERGPSDVEGILHTSRLLEGARVPGITPRPGSYLHWRRDRKRQQGDRRSVPETEARWKAGASPGAENAADKLAWWSQRLRELERIDRGEDPNPRYVNEFFMDKRRTQVSIGCGEAIAGWLIVISGLICIKNTQP